MKHGARILGLVLALAALPAAAQDILTADQFFAQVSERYAQINDYEGRIAIQAGKETMSGVIAYRSPSFLRIDFLQPLDQVIVFDGT
ncbi:MAG: outer membrane lipoprotein carrier protein LolA, partial [Spirochaetaceae bacterium]|nr:outer membrane lipoprotein carrier protein LolA [Spirochaetaceae bacterium]